MTTTDLAIGLTIGYYLNALIVLSIIVLPDHTPKHWPLAYTAITYALAPIAALPALLLALAIRMTQPTKIED